MPTRARPQDGICAYCHAPLHGQAHTGLPCFDYPGYMDENPDGDRYCSARCIRKRTLELFWRRRHLVYTGRVHELLGWPETANEKWVRYTAEIPPELSAILEHVYRRDRQRRPDGRDEAPHAAIVRAALSEWLERHGTWQEPPLEAESELDAGELEAG